MIFGILSWVPVDKYQKAYLDEFHRVKAKPQKRIDSAYRYVEHIDNGGIPNSYQVAPNDLRRHASKRLERKNKLNRYRKPYYIRDKYNRSIIYPYRG